MTDLLAADLLLVHLPRGRDHAQSIGSLAERLGWSRRAVEAAVQELRHRELPVASCAAGVYVGDLRDIEETMAQLERRLAPVRHPARHAPLPGRAAQGAAADVVGIVTPHYADDWLTVYGGDVRDVLPTLPDESVDCVVTSPPYWGLRDYGTATWDGGEEGCDHVGLVMRTAPPGTEKQASNRGASAVTSGDCRCGVGASTRSSASNPPPRSTSPTSSRCSARCGGC